MRAVALLGPAAKEHHVRPFEIPGVNLFTGNELDPTDQPDAVLIFGGDGTIHRHLGGLVHKQIPALIVPLGSANDFARSIGLETMEKALAAWLRFCAAGDNLRCIDLGTIQALAVGTSKSETEDGADDFRACMESGAAKSADLPEGTIEFGLDSHCRANFGPRPGAQGFESKPWEGESLESLHFVPDGRRTDLPAIGPGIMQSQLRRLAEAQAEVSRTTFFGCIAGTGLDAAVNRSTLKQPRWLRSHGGYVLALLRVLGGFRPPRITVSVKVGGRWKTHLDQPGFLIAAGNGPQYGHGMRLAHRARMDDGLLDVCFVKTLSKPRLLRLFRLVYRGAHIGMAEAEYFQAECVRVQTDPVSEIFADGEYICQSPVEIGVRRNALRLIADV